MSRKKISYARKTCVIDPEEEGEELPFEAREITLHKDYGVTRDYQLLELLGRGKFGEVKRCKEMSTGLLLAAKTVAAYNEEDKVQVRKEIEIMAQLRHPKVLQVYDAFENPKSMCIIMELVEGGELFDRVVDPNFDLTERVAILFMRQIVEGMAFIHDQSILHLDMKPENIICVAKTGTRVKIIDFGLAVQYKGKATQKVMAGTVEFMAPEVANYDDISPSTDMWSIGVICYVLVSGLSPFVGSDDAETICNIMTLKYDFSSEEFEEITAGCKDFIKKLLIIDSKKRLSAEECLKHSWLQKISRAQTNKHLSKKHHVKFFAKRKWNKIINVVLAINRLERLCNVPSVRESFKKQPINQLSVSVAKQTVKKLPDWKSRLEARKRERNTTGDAHKEITPCKLEKEVKVQEAQANSNELSIHTPNSNAVERSDVEAAQPVGAPKVIKESTASLVANGLPPRSRFRDRNLDGNSAIDTGSGLKHISSPDETFKEDRRLRSCVEERKQRFSDTHASPAERPTVHLDRKSRIAALASKK